MTEPTDEEIAQDMVRAYAPASPHLRDQMTQAIASALRSARLAERERCAKVADLYAETNREAAGDTILHDPVLRGKGFTPEDVAKSEEMMIDGCIHSSMYHAAKNIAVAIRETDSDAK